MSAYCQEQTFVTSAPFHASLQLFIVQYLLIRRRKFIALHGSIVMVASDVNCPKCKAKMEEGFNLEFGHNNRTSAESWVAGRPEGGWLGLKI